MLYTCFSNDFFLNTSLRTEINNGNWKSFCTSEDKSWGEGPEGLAEDMYKFVAGENSKLETPVIWQVGKIVASVKIRQIFRTKFSKENIWMCNREINEVSHESLLWNEISFMSVIFPQNICKQNKYLYIQ